jgi:uncharacterized membrane protein
MRAVARGLAWASVVWLLLILAAPFLLARGLTVGAVPYVAGRTICHQRPERSFHLDRVQMPVCGRCFGLYAAAPAGAFAALLAAPRRRGLRSATNRWALGLAAVPTLATLIIEWSGAGGVSSLARALAAAPFGAMVAWVLVRECRGAGVGLQVN